MTIFLKDGEVRALTVPKPMPPMDQRTVTQAYAEAMVDYQDAVQAAKDSSVRVENYSPSMKWHPFQMVQNQFYTLPDEYRMKIDTKPALI